MCDLQAAPATPAILLDVDGTLIDSYPGVADSLIKTLTHCEIPIPPDAQLRRFLGPPLAESMRLAHVPETQIPEAIAIYREHYLSRGWRNATLYPGWEQTLKRWKDKGYILATATSKGQSTAAMMLEELGVAQYFDFIGGADDQGGTRPTKQKVIEWVLENLKLDPHTQPIMMVGDRSYDTDGARPLGLATTLVTWGHGNTEEWNNADYIAHSTHDLERIIDVYSSFPNTEQA